jgi:hypothetical protein
MMKPDFDEHRWEDDGGPPPPSDEPETSRDAQLAMLLPIGGYIIVIYVI